MTNSFEPPLPQRLETQLIEPTLTRPKAILAALMSAGYSAIVQVADGAVWEDEPDIVVDPGLRTHATRMALIWKRAAENLQGGLKVVTRPRPRNPADPGKGIPCGFRTDRPIR